MVLQHQPDCSGLVPSFGHASAGCSHGSHATVEDCLLLKQQSQFSVKYKANSYICNLLYGTTENIKWKKHYAEHSAQVP
jgi:hypothetical protein